MVYSECDLSTTGPRMAISIKGSVKEGPRWRKRIRSERLDGEIWSAFWLAILGNSIDFLSIFFVYDLDSCTLIKTSRVREKEKVI